MELAVTQGLASVIREIVPKQIAQKNVALKEENARLLEALYQSKAIRCSACNQYWPKDQYKGCGHCHTSYCPNCLEGKLFNCAQKFCKNNCPECDEKSICKECELEFCNVHITDCKHCSLSFCNAHYRPHKEKYHQVFFGLSYQQ